jgi:hypothetical protein
MAVDPTYPLLPVLSIICSTLLFVVLTTNLAHERWNLGVLTLCFWLFIENLITGVSTIVWSDNADIKALVYCDIGRRRFLLIKPLGLPSTIVTHVQMLTFIIKPACSLVITRRLSKIASLRVIDANTREEVSSSTFIIGKNPVLRLDLET